MRAGNLDRRITLQSLTLTQDSYGSTTETWADFATVWAEARPVLSRERFSAQHVAVEFDTVFRIRWLSGVLQTMRISYDGKYYDIQSIVELGRRAGLELQAKARE